MYRVYRGDVSKLTDVVRCQIVFAELPQVHAFLSRLKLLHDKDRLEIIRIRNRMDDDYNATALTAGYRDCNVKVQLAFELDNTSGAVRFQEISRSEDTDESRVIKSCFGLGSFVTKELKSCHAHSKQLHFVCELQLILQVTPLLLAPAAWSTPRLRPLFLFSIINKCR